MVTLIRFVFIGEILYIALFATNATQQERTKKREKMYSY